MIVGGFGYALRSLRYSAFPVLLLAPSHLYYILRASSDTGFDPASLFAGLSLGIDNSAPKIQVTGVSTVRELCRLDSLFDRWEERAREEASSAFDANAAITVVLPWPEAGAETKSAGQ